MSHDRVALDGVLGSPLVPQLSRCTIISTLGCLVICLFLASCGGAGSQPTGSSSTTAAPPPPPPSISIVISPPATSLDQGATLVFNATVNGTSNQNVTWSVQEGVSGGSVNAGTYLAPFSAGTFHVVATSVADPTKQAIATVTVRTAFIGVFPDTATLGPLSFRSFHVQVFGTVDTDVVWNVLEGPAGGSVDANGNYIAASNQGVYHVQATSVADPSLTGAATITVLASGFVPTGSMQYPRTGEKAVLLPASGNVLVTGGMEFVPVSTSLPYSELYVPGNKAFQSTGDMNQGRAYHSATLLADGRVLVVGGFFESPFLVLSSAEIFTPGTGAFTSTGNLATPRYSHTATLLPSGKVLVTGGVKDLNDVADAGALDTTELWDASTGSFVAAGSMTTSRQGHTATFLPSTGKVLIVGGSDFSGNILKSAELYDPATATFSPTGDLGTGRVYQTATLLPDGRVLITGGKIDANLKAKTTEIYDPATGTFSSLANLLNDRSNHTATLLPSGKVLLAGGLDSDDSPLFAAELFDPVANASAETGSMGHPRYDHTATLLPDGTVLVTGGGLDNTAEIYIP
jgi:hypothetical protein